jgi:spermidine/putrescine transport system ATP-binding protein
MKDIVFNNVYKSYKNEKILTDFSFKIPGGTFFTLLGPSGCGKTTLLRLIGGFEEVDKGTIYFGDQNISDIPAHQRKVNTVFQNYALFPHLTVEENIAYGLKIKKIDKNIIKQRVDNLLESFSLIKVAHKYPKELSGGQQQRVAIARAIINEPDILLLDEPLSALDLKTREKTLLELVELQDQLKTTFVYVTHDQFEALAISDYVAIMSDGGVVQQVGTPQEVYEEPDNSFVALFVGTTNILEGNIDLIEEKPYFLCQSDLKIPLEVKLNNSSKNFLNYKKLSIRPEKILMSENKNDFEWSLMGTIHSIVYYGRSTEYLIKTEFGIITVFEQNEKKNIEHRMDYEETVYMWWNKEDNVLLAE